MKLLVAFALVFFVNGKVVRKPSRPTWGSNLFKRNIGACTLRAVTFNTQGCQNDFYVSFRRDITKPCRVRFREFSNCYLKTIKDCLGKTRSGRALGDALHQYNQSIWQYKKFQCGEVDYRPSQWFPQFPVNDECPKEMPGKLDECVNKWYRVFQQTPGNRQLCSLYHSATRCMREVMVSCSFDLSENSWIFSKCLNPFCESYSNLIVCRFQTTVSLTEK